MGVARGAAMAVAALHPTRALLSLMVATTPSVWLLAIGFAGFQPS